MVPKSMPPSTTTNITPGQIDRIQDRIAVVLRRSGLPSEALQKVLMMPGDPLSADILAAISTRVESVSNIIIRRVKIDASRTPQEALDATGHKQATDRGVVNSMPRNNGGEVEVLFFKPRPEAYVNGGINQDRLATEFDYWGIKPDPIAVAAVNEADPEFVTAHGNGVQWKDADGKWCYLAFWRLRDEPEVICGHGRHLWGDGWIFGGVRLPAGKAGK